MAGEWDGICRKSTSNDSVGWSRQPQYGQCGSETPQDSRNTEEQMSSSIYLHQRFFILCTLKREMRRVWDTNSGQFFCAGKRRLCVGPCGAEFDVVPDRRRCPAFPNGPFPRRGYCVTARARLAMLLALSAGSAAVRTWQQGLTLSLEEKSFFNRSFWEQLLGELLMHVNLWDWGSLLTALGGGEFT